MKRKIERKGADRKISVAGKIGATTLAVAMIATSFVGAAGAGTYAASKNDKSSSQAANTGSYSDVFSPNSTSQKDKSETVYAVLDAEGNKEKVVVNEWLTNKNGAKEISDTSDLKDIKNTSGNQKFTKDGDKVTWKADGSDIHYQGTTGKQLPVDVAVSYYLNGEQVSAKDIAGKSGDVEIHFDYNVNRSELADGSSVTKPYTMASAVMLDNSHFTNVTVDNGKVVNDGNTSMCIGIAFPGLAGNLGLGATGVSIPDSVVIKAHTDKFQIDGTYTAAMSGVMSDIDTSATGNVESKVSQLESGLDQLVSASDKLMSGTDQLKAGIDQLNAGAGTLNSKTGDLTSGAKQVADGAGQVNAGVSELNNKTDALAGGAKKVSEGATLLDKNVQAAVDQINKQLQGAIVGDEQKAAKGQAAYNAAASLADSEGNKTAVANGADQLNQGINTAIYTAAETALCQAKGYKSITDVPEPIRTEIQNTARAIAGGVETNSGINAQVTGALQKTAGTAAQATAVAAVDEANKATLNMQNSLASSIKELTEGTAQLSAGAKQVSDGTQQAKGGISQLAAGTNQLNAGAQKLNTGVGQYGAGVNQLYSGTTKLTAGAATLDSGMAQFNKEGIHKMADTLNGSQLLTIGKRIKAAADADRIEYLIGGKSAGMSGESKIIYKTAEVK
ncbi:MAG: hypothetical protein MSS24_04830 [Clostridiales bacterium]|nr:hypothetical protein [Clostridiales bacterium]